MIVLYIVLFLLLLLLFIILFSDISLIFSYKNSFKFTIRFLFFNLGGNKLLELIESRQDKPKEIKEANKTLSKPKKKLSYNDVIELVSLIVGLIKAVLKEFKRYARLKVCSLNLSIGNEEADKTALIYGAASSAVYTILEVLDNVLLIKKNYKKISIYPDFTSDECKIDFKVVLKLKTIHLLLAFFHVAPSLTEIKKGK